MEVLVLAPVNPVSQLVDVAPELAIGLHELLGEVHRLNHPIAQRLGVQPVEQRAALALLLLLSLLLLRRLQGR